MRKFTVMLAAVALASCGSGEKQPSAADTTKGTKVAAVAPDTKPQPERPKSAEEVRQQVAEFQDSIEKAMSDIPPDLREKFQEAFACEIEKNQKLPAPKDVDAQTIRAITARLKAGGAAC